MTVKRKHQRKRAYEGNPEVPIRVEILNAAIKDRGWKPSELVRRTGIRQQTISALLNAKRSGRRCRADHAQRIAKALEMPIERLIHGVDVTPYSPFIGAGCEFRYSPQTEYAASRLFSRCAEACRRDVARDPTRSAGIPPAFLMGQIVTLLGELLQIGRWRGWLLEWDPKVRYARGFTEPATRNVFDEDAPDWSEVMEGTMPEDMFATLVQSRAKPELDSSHEVATLSLCRAMEHILTPWFDDQAKLNYDALYRLTALPAAVSMRVGVDPFDPTAAVPAPDEPRRRSAKQSPQSGSKPRARAVKKGSRARGRTQ